MTDIAISVKNLSKKYNLYDSPKHRLKEALNPFGKKYHKDFYALDDVSFDVLKGETMGIVGKNGSGKSTLLKIVTGVLTPSGGTVNVKGRISALLELGAGFNLEYSGMDNIYFNGSLIGFTKEEMDAKLDDILSFADIGDFVYQPVKVYSSGMFLRLAFAVATVVEPDILIVDEALSVGDAKFQRKCFARFEDFRAHGNTILFVSHDVNTVNLLCNRALFLNDGKMMEIGEARVVTKRYHKMLFGEAESEKKGKQGEKNNQDEGGKIPAETTSQEQSEADADTADVMGESGLTVLGDSAEVEEMLSSREVRYGDGKAEIFDAGILDRNHKRVNLLTSGDKYTLFFRVFFREYVENLSFGCRIQNTRGVDLFAANTSYHNIAIPSQKKGDVMECRFDVTMNLGPGDFFLTFGVRSLDLHLFYDRRVDAFQFKVQSDASTDSACLVNLDEALSVSLLKEGHG